MQTNMKASLKKKKMFVVYNEQQSNKNIHNIGKTNLTENALFKILKLAKIK